MASKIAILRENDDWFRTTVLATVKNTVLARAKFAN